MSLLVVKNRAGAEVSIEDFGFEDTLAMTNANFLPESELSDPIKAAQCAQQSWVASNKERCVALFFTASGTLRSVRMMLEGKVDAAKLPIKNIVRSLFDHRCESVLLLHVYPTPSPTFNDADQRTVSGLSALLAALEFRLLSYVVVGSSDWCAYHVTERGINRLWSSPQNAPLPVEPCRRRPARLVH